MPKRSSKENKNIYLRCREDAKLTREAAAEKLEYISADRIYRIENGVLPNPEEVLSMAKCYQNPALCNYYCANECQIGQVYVPEVQMKDLSQITLEVLSTLSQLNRDKERLIEIAVDGVISEEEMSDFRTIRETLEKMALAVSSLTLWVDQRIADGEIDQAVR